MDTVSRGEMVESELDGLIRRRHDQRVSEEQGRVEDGWAESARVYNARQEAEKRADRYQYHLGQADRLKRTMGELVAYHESEAERYLQDEPKGAA